MANDEEELGRYERSVQDLRKAMLLDPSRASTYANLAVGLLALNQVNEASAVLAEADERSFQTDILLQAHYWIAFLRNDEKEMERLVQRSSDVPGARRFFYPSNPTLRLITDISKRPESFRVLPKI